MDRTTTSNWIVLAIEGTLVLASLIGLSRRVDFCRLRSRLWSFLQKAKPAIVSPGGSDDDDDEVGRIVRAKMQQVSMENFKWSLQALCLVVTVSGCMIMMNIALGTATRKKFSTDLLEMVAHGILLLPMFFPRLLSWKTIDGFYGVFVLFSAVIVSPWFCEPGKGALFVMMLNLPVLFLNMIRRDLRIVAPLNLVYAISSCCTFYVEREALPIQPTFMILVEILFLLIVPMYGQLLEGSMAMAIRQSLEVQAAKELLAAASALLRSCCDVVVDLDYDGMILSPALDLRSFLLRSPIRTLQHTRLVDLMTSEEDKVMFLRKLRAPVTSGVGLAEAIHVHMRDGDNNKLQVEILSFEYRHLDGQSRYLTGLREFSDTPVVRKGNRRRHPELEHSQRSDVSAVSGTDMSEDPSEVLSDDNDESGPSQSPSVIGNTTWDLSAAVVIVDSTVDRLPIRGVSSGFQIRIGRLTPGSCLLDLIENGDDFANWMEMAVLYGDDWPNARVTFHTRRGRLKASCRVVQDSEDAVLDPERISLLLSHIKPCRGHHSVWKPQAQARGTGVIHMAL